MNSFHLTSLQFTPIRSTSPTLIDRSAETTVRTEPSRTVRHRTKQLDRTAYLQLMPWSKFRCSSGALQMFESVAVNFIHSRRASKLRLDWEWLRVNSGRDQWLQWLVLGCDTRPTTFPQVFCVLCRQHKLVFALQWGLDIQEKNCRQKHSSIWSQFFISSWDQSKESNALNDKKGELRNENHIRMVSNRRKTKDFLRHFMATKGCDFLSIEYFGANTRQLHWH